MRIIAIRYWILGVLFCLLAGSCTNWKERQEEKIFGKWNFTKAKRMNRPYMDVLHRWDVLELDFKTQGKLEVRNKDLGYISVGHWSNDFERIDEDERMIVTLYWIDGLTQSEQIYEWVVMNVTKRTLTAQSYITDETESTEFKLKR